LEVAAVADALSALRFPFASGSVQGLKLTPDFTGTLHKALVFADCRSSSYAALAWVFT
jgi:hypothetical protein